MVRYCKAQTGVFGIILLIVLFVFIFAYIAPFFGIASDIMSINVNSGMGGWFFSNWMSMIFLLFVLVVLWKIAGG